MSLIVGGVLRLGLLRRDAANNSPSAEIRAELHLRQSRIHGELRYFEGTLRAFYEHDRIRQDTLHDDLRRVHDADDLLHVHGRRGSGLRLSSGGVGIAIACVVVVFGHVLAGVSDIQEHFSVDAYHALQRKGLLTLPLSDSAPDHLSLASLFSSKIQSKWCDGDENAHPSAVDNAQASHLGMRENAGDVHLSVR